MASELTDATKAEIVDLIRGELRKADLGLRGFEPTTSITIGLDADLGVVFNAYPHEEMKILAIQQLRVLRQIRDALQPKPTT